MIEIKQVKTKKQQRDYIFFPNKLYKDNDCFVPFLAQDEKKLFSKNSIYREDCDFASFLAYKDGKVVGRVTAVDQKSYNTKNNEKRCRFTRFDLINDVEVAKGLLNAVEEFAKQRGLDTIHGPLGFNDLDREGLLIDGFDELATFEENYNAPYYKDLLEQCGYEKEVDWYSFEIIPPKENERVKRLSEEVLKRYNLHIAKAKNIREYLKKYQDQIFDVVDEAYGPLYGVVPYTDGLRKSIVSQFKLIIDQKFVISLLNENEEVVAFGLALPSLARAVQKSRGKYFPTGLFRILKARKTYDTIDFALIGVRQKYQGSGMNAVILNYIIDQCNAMGVKRIETNLNLEYNNKIILTWKNFEDHKQNKQYRCFIKKLGNSEQE